MIWFACKQCGKTLGRPESAIGATIFCACGTGVVVPWESTAQEPPAPPAAPEAELKLEPMPLEAEPDTSRPPPVRPRRRQRMGQRDPSVCFNHDESPRDEACADCGESFCRDCLVSLEGAALCGPCKNYRVKNLQRTETPSSLAVISVLIIFLTGPFAVCLLPGGQPGFPWWTLIALVPQGVAAALAIQALRAADKGPQSAGQALALTGLLSAAVTMVLIVLLTLYTPHAWT